MLTADAVTAMTTDHSRLSSAARRPRSPSSGERLGNGVQVLTPEHDPNVRPPRYGWGGGLGTLWYLWPNQRTAAVVLTQVLPPSRELIDAFTGGVATASTACEPSTGAFPGFPQHARPRHSAGARIAQRTPRRTWLGLLRRCDAVLFVVSVTDGSDPFTPAEGNQ